MDGLFLYDTEIGRIAIGENGGAIALLRLPGEEVPGTVVQHETGTASQSGGAAPGIPARGTEDVRFAIGARRYGVSESGLERFAGNPLWADAVLWGNRRADWPPQGVPRSRYGEPLQSASPIFIPCHRVVGADGSLTGYAGGLECKRTLLDLERRYGAR